ncbi:hypothetical protein CU633_17435, partial [Bacillus sp. V3-13]
MYQAAQQVGRQGQYGVGAMGPQAVFQPGFAGTDANQVRQDIFGTMVGDGFTQQAGGLQGGMVAGGLQDGFQIRRGMQGSPQM